ncbi:SMP-30/gluconolactonase/LRE family protein [Streptomyces netropsis]
MGGKSVGRVGAGRRGSVDGGVPLLDWRENLEFDGRGTLWVSHLTKNRVEGDAPDGTLKASFPVPGPGGIRRGPDGMMYVNFGVNPPARDGGIMRFDPAADRPRAERFVDGISGVNGLAVDADGNFYLSRALATGIIRIRPDGTWDAEWTRKADVFGTNGLEVVGDQLYASVITHTASPVVRIPLKDPAQHTTVTELSPNPLKTKLLDDLTFFDGDLVVASFRDGELIRVDPTTGRSCVLVKGLRTPTSVRGVRAFGDHDPRREMFVVEASGRILEVTVG